MNVCGLIQVAQYVILWTDVSIEQVKSQKIQIADTPNTYLSKEIKCLKF